MRLVVRTVVTSAEGGYTRKGMVSLKVHFDGNVFVPDEPVNLPSGATATVVVDSKPGTNHVNPRKPSPQIEPVLTGLDPELVRGIGQDPEFDLENA